MNVYALSSIVRHPAGVLTIVLKMFDRKADAEAEAQARAASLEGAARALGGAFSAIGLQKVNFVVTEVPVAGAIEVAKRVPPVVR